MAGDDTNRRERLALAIVSGMTVADAAAEAHVSERTAFRWLVDPTLRDRIAELRGDVLRRSLDRLVGLADTAADTLHAVLTDEDAAPSARVAAARTVFASLLSLREATDLGSRLAEIEQALARWRREPAA